MNKNIKDLEPKAVWNYFYDLTQIPRPSCHEKKVAEYIVNFAKSHNLSYEVDAVGNVIIDVPATPDKKDSPRVILQGHMDMVPVSAEGYEFNFEKDPVTAYIDGGYVKADRTTLGADNGIAIAMTLAMFADNSLSHGPLRAIFTVEEETSMKGAMNLDAKYLVDASYLINLDSEENGYLYVNCAGSWDIDIGFDCNLVNTEQSSAIKLSLLHFAGGHSGTDIKEGCANAIQVMASILDSLSDDYDFFIQDISGGTVRNSIPAKAAVTIALPDSLKDSFVKDFEKQFAKQKEHYRITDPDMAFKIEEAKTAKVIGYAQTQDLIHLLRALPSGIIRMSKQFTDVVETSINLSMVKMKGDRVTIYMMPRSLEAEGLNQIAQSVKACCYLLDNVEVETSNLHHPWSSPSQNRLIDVLQTCYKEVSGHEFKISAMHAGVECAKFAQLNQQLQLISIGPTILNPHSPQERVDINGTKQMYLTVSRALAML